MQKYQYVMVEWTDIISDPSWTSVSNASKQLPAPCVTVGHLIKVNRAKGVLVIGHSIMYKTDKHEPECDFTVIPLGAVKAMYRMKRNGEMVL